MRCMDRNKIPFYYALYDTKVEIEDDYGNKTGQYELSYGNPIRCKANISAAMGERKADSLEIAFHTIKSLYSMSLTRLLMSIQSCGLIPYLRLKPMELPIPLTIT